MENANLLRIWEHARLPGNYTDFDRHANIWNRQYADEMSDNIRAPHHDDISITLSN